MEQSTKGGEDKMTKEEILEKLEDIYDDLGEILGYDSEEECEDE